MRKLLVGGAGGSTVAAVADVTCRALRRALPRILAVGAAASITVGALASIAGATTFTTPGAQAQINATQQQLNQIEQQITQDEQQSAILGQEYDAAETHVQQVQAALAKTAAEIVQDKKTIAVDKAVLAKAAVKAYVLGEQSTQITPLFNSDVSTADVSEEYSQTAVDNLAQAKKALEDAKAKLNATEAQQQTEEQQAQAAAAQLATLQQKSEAATQAAHAMLASVTGKLKAEVAHAEQVKQQKEAAAAAAAAALKKQQEEQAAALAAQQAAQLAAEVSGGTTSGGGSPPPPPPAGGGTPVGAAESQLTVPYVWGAETPKGSPHPGFDCSGLTQWSWRQAGVYIPRTSQSQYYAGSVVWTVGSGSSWTSAPVAPGDLFLYRHLDATNTVDHVAMYVGHGTLIQAPFPGTHVSYHSVYTGGLVRIVRP